MLKNIVSTLAIVLITMTLLTPLLSTEVNAAGLADSDWPCYQGNAQRTGLSTNGVGSNPGLKNWEKYVGGNVYISPIIGPDGTIYVFSSYGSFAFDKDGNQLWTNDWEGEDAGRTKHGVSDMHIMPRRFRVHLLVSPKSSENSSRGCRNARR